MQFNDRLLSAPDLEAVIERVPLIVSPNISLASAIALMSQARGSLCQIPLDGSSEEILAGDLVNSSCALILDGSKLLGILTERDIVRLTAEEVEFGSITVAEVMTQPVVSLQQNNFKDIFAALFLFRRYRIRHLPIVDEDNNLIGIISPETIRQAMRPANLLKLRRVADVMSRNIIDASLDTSVLDVARLMSQHRVSCIVITQEDPRDNILIPVGIITEGDIMQFQTLQLRLHKIKVRQVMSTPLFLLSPEDSLLTANQEMQRRRVRRLVVSWNWGQGLGIITQTSLLRIFDPMEMYSVIETLQDTIQQLELEKAQLLTLVKDSSN
ncbi:MAG: CBS domain-containing protein [Pleurocapsa sp.]